MMIAAASLLHHVWHIIATAAWLLLAILATAHVVLKKRDPGAAIAWVGLVWLVPIVGAAMYILFGVNRIRHRATWLRRNLERYRAFAWQHDCGPEALNRHLPDGAGHLAMLARVVGRVVEQPLLAGNRIEPLVNGDEAYPAMLEAIRQARRTISLVTYIFAGDEAGVAFARALGDAARHGVQVRVLVDALGTAHSWRSIHHFLKREGVRYAQFLPLFSPWHIMSMNMRTHRKIMVVDGRVGFTGGTNIRSGHCLQRHPRHPIGDIHFRVAGPVVTQLQEVFADDWLFTTGETLRGDSWFAEPQAAGRVLARAVTDGPDENFEKLLWTLLGAVSIARHSVQIMSPYFLPDATVITALNMAAMRGVEVDIILPERVDWRVVSWASQAMWSQLLEHGCRIWLSPPPFDHSKLVMVDGCWVLLGSANWDARSLRLNFEFNLECYDVELATRLEGWVAAKRKRAHRVTIDQMDGRSLPGRLRDGVARLLTPYL